MGTATKVKLTVLQRVAEGGRFTRDQVENLAAELEDNKGYLETLSEHLDGLTSIELDEGTAETLEQLGGEFQGLADALATIDNAKTQAQEVKDAIELYVDHASTLINEWESWADEEDRETRADYRESLVDSAAELEDARDALVSLGVNVGQEY